MKTYTNHDRARAKLVAKLAEKISNASVTLSHLANILEVTKGWTIIETYTCLELAANMELVELLPDEHGVISVYHEGANADE